MGEARLRDEFLAETDCGCLGDWPIGCVKNGAPTTTSARLVVRQNAVHVAPSTDATTKITILRPSPNGHLVTVEGPDKSALTIQMEDISGLEAGMAVSLTPKDASILAFDATE